MISRQWRGIARPAAAEQYVEHLRSETFPQLSGIPGFIDGSILRRRVIDGVEFMIVTRWASLDAIRSFAGDSAERAVVPEQVQRMLVRYDAVATHYEIVA